MWAAFLALTLHRGAGPHRARPSALRPRQRLRRELITIPARVVHHARQLLLRLAPTRPTDHSSAPTTCSTPYPARPGRQTPPDTTPVGPDPAAAPGDRRRHINHPAHQASTTSYARPATAAAPGAPQPRCHSHRRHPKTRSQSKIASLLADVGLTLPQRPHGAVGAHPGGPARIESVNGCEIVLGSRPFLRDADVLTVR